MSERGILRVEGNVVTGNFTKNAARLSLFHEKDNIIDLEHYKKSKQCRKTTAQIILLLEGANNELADDIHRFVYANLDSPMEDEEILIGVIEKIKQNSPSLFDYVITGLEEINAESY